MHRTAAAVTWISRVAAVLAALAAGVIIVSCGPPRAEPASVAGLPPTIPLPTTDHASPVDYPGIHNAVAFHDGFVSGAVPEGDAGFETLASMGIRTIISVDGAVPDVERADARGIRYIHLPIGYDGFDEDRRLQLARATRDALAEGPVYIHCHHGKHRSAGAAASIASALGWETPEHGVARMKVSGTSPKYTGLYACAAESELVSMGTLDAVPADFPARWKPSSFVAGMVEFDTAFEHLKLIQKAGWTSPADHPDLVPVAEAGRLADLHRDLAASDSTRRRPADFAQIMEDGRAAAHMLETLLLASDPDPAAMDLEMERLAASCSDCHAPYRNVPASR